MHSVPFKSEDLPETATHYPTSVNSIGVSQSIWQPAVMLLSVLLFCNKKPNAPWQKHPKQHMQMFKGRLHVCNCLRVLPTECSRGQSLGETEQSSSVVVDLSLLGDLKSTSIFKFKGMFSFYFFILFYFFYSPL